MASYLPPMVPTYGYLWLPMVSGWFLTIGNNKKKYKKRNIFLKVAITLKIFFKGSHMGHPRRKFEHNRPYFITNRLSEGLPFVANLYINLVLFGILARAQAQFPSIVICAWLFMGNHYHAIIVPTGDPRDIAGFMHYVDGEIAKAVCRLLGKRNCKIWAQRYNAVALLTPEAVIRQYIYTFINPVAAHLIDRVGEWTGCTTWTDTLDNFVKSYQWIRPGSLHKLPNGPFREKVLKARLQELEDSPTKPFPLEIRPLAWTECFFGSATREVEVIKKEIFCGISEAEKRYRKERLRKKLNVTDPKSLAAQNPHQRYQPKKFGRRVFCMSTCAALRKEFIKLYRDFCERCEETWKAWCRGDFSVTYPPGAFLPSCPPRANIVSESG